jgi:hypothetical protein
MPTWATKHLEFAPALELPVHGSNGSGATGVGGPDTAKWNERIDDLLAIRQLEDGWDGQGSPAPSVEVVDSALVLALLLRKEGIAPPDGVVQGPRGAVHFDWQPPDGKYVELEVVKPYLAHVHVVDLPKVVMANGLL